jgi:hypothetical protein
MDGFRVETTGLAQAASKYGAIAGQLSEDADRLRGLMGELGGQTLGGNLYDMLRGAIRTVEATSEESRELGGQCVEMAGVYERVEKQVASLVASLPSVSPFADAASPGLPDRVSGPYRPAKPVLFNGNRLPCESWLLDRAIKASLEGES